MCPKRALFAGLFLETVPDNWAMKNTPELPSTGAADPVTSMAQACAQLDALTALLSKTGAATVSCAHVSALLEPLNERLQAAHEQMDSRAA